MDRVELSAGGRITILKRIRDELALERAEVLEPVIQPGGAALLQRARGRSALVALRAHAKAIPAMIEEMVAGVGARARRTAAGAR
ncbi:MAG TPA: hypothetical protein VMT85_10975 [Thermoanaerobaculia bacterium]|nr:hypothetical protein [Thermoanaerobaculia bacterium]